jgi:catechol 2,3-dioxygenase-like lactoylglutathione lyase family enzyme
MRLRVEIFPVDLDATVALYTAALGFELDRDERGTASAT